MSLGKWKRRALVVLFAPLPRERARLAYQWVAGRDAARQLRQADVAIASDAKAGRTWLRVMVSRVYQQRHGLADGALMRLDNFRRQAPAVPSVFFTHDNHLGRYRGSYDPAVCYAGKKVVLMVRDPRDLSVSMFYQWTYRMDASKKVFSQRDRGEISMSEYVLGKHAKIRNSINFLNRWAAALPRMPEVLVVRYEDLRREPAKWLGEVLAFMGTPASDQELEEAVAYASFEAMRAREAAADDAASRKLRPGAKDNPASFKTRRGKVGGYRDHFNASELAQMDALVDEELAPCFGYGRGAAPEAEPVTADHGLP